MNPTVVGVVVFLCTFLGTMAGMGLRNSLPDHHLNDDSKDSIKLGIGLIATMTALILGLVTASAKSSFDEVSTTVRHSAADILSLDRLLDRYGPETAELRKALKLALAARVEMIWPRDSAHHTRLDPPDAGRGAEMLATKIRGLKPQTDDQRWLQSRAQDLAERVLDARWAVFTGNAPSVPAAFLATLVFWLTITFTSFGLFAPRNATVIAIMFVCAVSVAGAVFLVLEMDQPFDGVIKVSAEPMRNTLARLNP